MPRLVEVNVSASNGGKVQVKKFDITLDYHFSNSERWDVSDISEEEAEAFRIERTKKVQAAVEKLGKEEFDTLMAMSEELNGSGD